MGTDAVSKIDFAALVHVPRPEEPTATVMCRVEIDGTPLRFAVAVNDCHGFPSYVIASWAEAKVYRLVYDVVADECESFYLRSAVTVDRSE